MRIQDEAELRAMLARGGARVVEEPRPGRDLFLPLSQSPRAAKVDRYRSKTERLYAQTILDIGVANGLLKGYWYEPSKGLYLAPAMSYTPDFLLEYVDPMRPLEFHEIKGAFIRDKDWQKTKQAAAIYSCFRFILAQWKDQRWRFKDVPAL